MAATKRWLLDDLQDLDAPIKRHAVLAAELLVMPLALDHFCLGAFHILMVWLMVAGLGRAARGRPWSGGLLLGMAVWVKLLPLMGVGYLVLKRKWLAAGVALARRSQSTWSCRRRYSAGNGRGSCTSSGGRTRRPGPPIGSWICRKWWTRTGSPTNPWLRSCGGS